MTYRDNARKGMKLMNRVHGEGWVDDFSLEKFNIRMPWDCIIGQVYGGKPGAYNHGLSSMFAGMYTHRDELSGLDVKYGFDVPRNARATSLDALQDEWTIMIREQKAQRGWTQ